MNDHRRRNAQRGVLATRLALVFCLLLLNAVTGYAAPWPTAATGFAVVTLPTSALALPTSFAQPLPSSGNPKMDSDLAALASGASAAGESAFAFTKSEGLKVRNNRVQVKITTHREGVQAVTSAVAAAGGEVTGSANGDTWVQAWVPITALETVSAADDVYYISRAAEAFPLGEEETTEGLAVMNGPAWHSAGFRGAGVKVAIIDYGFLGYPGCAARNCPPRSPSRTLSTAKRMPRSNGTTEHGTACAEVVHDIAPDASLYLVKVGTDVDLQEAVDWVKTQGVNIISTTLVWYNLSPGDGTGFFADLVQSARNSGIFWTTAAGNDREAHWGGAFSDGDGNGNHNFNGTTGGQLLRPWGW